ncbi:unnamed protein product [Caenorhabditis brenneri]
MLLLSGMRRSFPEASNLRLGSMNVTNSFTGGGPAEANWTGTILLMVGTILTPLLPIFIVFAAHVKDNHLINRQQYWNIALLLETSSFLVARFFLAQIGFSKVYLLTGCINVLMVFISILDNFSVCAWLLIMRIRSISGPHWVKHPIRAFFMASSFVCSAGVSYAAYIYRNDPVNSVIPSHILIISFGSLFGFSSLVPIFFYCISNHGQDIPVTSIKTKSSDIFLKLRQIPNKSKKSSVWIFQYAVSNSILKSVTVFAMLFWSQDQGVVHFICQCFLSLVVSISYLLRKSARKAFVKNSGKWKNSIKACLGPNTARVSKYTVDGNSRQSGNGLPSGRSREEINAERSQQKQKF